MSDTLHRRHSRDLRLMAKPRMTREAVGFIAIGLTGLAINQLLLVMFVQIGLGLVLAYSLNTPGSSTWNFFWTEFLVYKRGSRHRLRRYLGYMAINLSLLLVQGPVLVLLIGGFGISYLVANPISYIPLFAARFLLSRMLWWSRFTAAVEAKEAPMQATRPPTQLARHRQRWTTTAGRTFREAVGFGVVGLTGLGINQLVFWTLGGNLGLRLSLAAILATQASSTWNFLFDEAFVFRARRTGGGKLGRYLSFMMLSNATLLLRVPLLVGLVYRLGTPPLAANLISLAALFLLRFAVSNWLIWRGSGRPIAGMAASLRNPVQLYVDQKRDEHRPHLALVLPYRRRVQVFLYDIHGLVRIWSEVRLPELEYFRCLNLGGKPDIRIRRGKVGNRGLRSRVTALQAPEVFSYLEHIGNLGANFRVDFAGKRAQVTVSPLLARSPHVVYTNIIEALLRFVLAAHGRVLLHSATIKLKGQGVMLSAKTDTGKTGTIMRLLGEQVGGRFLSDDMTIIDETGNAWSFPKPLTISAHTLRAVNQRALRLHRRAFLAIQSRIHSKGGRRFALWLAQANIPILGINAITQILVPPPKYSIQTLVPCQNGRHARISRIVLIERGERCDEVVGHDAALEQLLANTADAYGFPPFAKFAPAITLGRQNSEKLSAREREILSGFLDHTEVLRMARPDFSWADDIPGLLERKAAGSAATVVAGNGHRHTTAEELLGLTPLPVAP